MEEKRTLSMSPVYVIIQNFEIYIISSDKLFMVNDICAIDRTID